LNKSPVAAILLSIPLPVQLLLSLLLLLVLPLSASGATAEETPPSVPVRLVEAIDMAMKRRPDLPIENERKKCAQSKVREARGNFLPTLDLLASSYYMENYDTFTGIDLSTRIANQDIFARIDKNVPPYQINGGLDFRFNLYAGGRDSALLAEALNNQEVTRHQEEITVRKIRLEVAKSYWKLKKAWIRYTVAKRTLEVVRLEVKVAETEHRVERRSEVEYHAVLLKSREKEVALKTADRECLRAFGSYLHVIGMEDRNAMAPSSSEQIPALLDDPESNEPSVEQTRAHPDILRLDSELRAASERKEEARSENYPKIDFFAKHSLVGRDSSSYLDSLGDTRSEYYMVGLKVTMNLFNGLRTKERIGQADSEVRAKQLQLVQKRRELAEAERIRKTELETAGDELLLALERKKLEEAREKVAESQLKSGRISQLEYRQKAADAETAADEVVTARIDVALARNALELMVLE